MFKKRLFSLVILLAALPFISAPFGNYSHNLETSLEARQTNPLRQDNSQFRTAFAYEQLTLDSTAGGIIMTAATYNPIVTDQPSQFSRAELAVVNCNNAQGRYKVDGGTVSTTVGMLIQDGDWFLVYGYANIVAFHGIRTGATSVVCDITYYRNR